MQPDVTEITDQQHQAIDLLLSGKTVRCIAAALDIRRETLWRWRQLPAFSQAIAERRAARHEEMQSHVSEIMRLALVALERELKFAEDPKKYNPLTTALAVLKLAQPHRLFLTVESKIEN